MPVELPLEGSLNAFTTRLIGQVFMLGAGSETPRCMCFRWPNNAFRFRLSVEGVALSMTVAVALDSGTPARLRWIGDRIATSIRRPIIRNLVYIFQVANAPLTLPAGIVQ